MDININLRAGNNHSVGDGKKPKMGDSRAYKRKRSKIKCNAHFNVHNVQFSSAWSVFYVCIYFDLAVVCPFAFIPFLSDCVLNTSNEEKNIVAMKKENHTRKACFMEKPYHHWTIELNRKMGSTKYPMALSVFSTHTQNDIDNKNSQSKTILYSITTASAFYGTWNCADSTIFIFHYIFPSPQKLNANVHFGGKRWNARENVKWCRTRNREFLDHFHFCLCVQTNARLYYLALIQSKTQIEREQKRRKMKCEKR